MQKTLVNQPYCGDNGDASQEASGDGALTPSTALTDPRDEVAEMADSDSTSGRAPAFQFYPKDFLADEHVRLMSLQERGAYITLICLCWSEGTIPADVDRIARVMGAPVNAVRKLWPAIEGCFRPSPRDANRLIHPRLERERQKQRAYRRRQADNGRKGGRPPQLDKSGGLAVGLPRANQSPSSDLVLSGSTLISSHTAVVKPPTPVDARSRHPSYKSDRFVVFDWQFADLSQMLGPHVDAFRLDEFFDALTQRSRAEGLVIPKSDVWAWLQAEVLAEAKRRGLPMAGTAPVIDKKAKEEAQNAEVLRLIQQDRENRSRYAGR